MATYRAAPAARKSSTAATRGGMAIPPTVTVTATANRSSMAEKPIALLVGRLLRANGELRLQLQEVLRTGDVGVHKRLGLHQGAVLRAVLDDPGGGLWADARERLGVGGTGGVDIDPRPRSGSRLRRVGRRFALRAGDGSCLDGDTEHGGEREQQERRADNRSSLWNEDPDRPCQVPGGRRGAGLSSPATVV